MFNLVGKRYLFLIISLIVIIPGVVSLIFKGMNVGIDFAGGATVELRPSSQITTAQAQKALAPLNLANLSIISGNNTTLPGSGVIWVRLNTIIDNNVYNHILTSLQQKYGSQLVVQDPTLTLGKSKVTVLTITKFTSGAPGSVSGVESALSNIPNTTSVSGSSSTTSTPTPAPTATATPKATPTPATASAATIPVKYTDVQTGNTTNTLQLLTSTTVNFDELSNIQAALLQNANRYSYTLNNASVSASVASETSSRAVLAVIAASVCILLYIWFSFRKVAKPWRYGACAIIALLHDVLVVLGIFSILGWAAHIQIDTLFITALLTVVGFSVHDTIVVFDRIRENMQRRTSETFDQVVNASLVQTMSRSLNTSLTVIFTLSALTLFGGTTIRTFTLALLIGIISGTYSSIFNASMLLVMWEKGELSLDRFKRHRTPPSREARELARTRG